MVLWGTKPRLEVVTRGKFHCPHCQRRRSYQHFRAATYFSVMFVPLYKNGTLADFVECRYCERHFSPSDVGAGDKPWDVHHADLAYAHYAKRSF